MKKIALFLIACHLLPLWASTTDDLEFLEAFAWGNREAALQALVPDTEAYYYFHCLHYQLRNERAAFHRTLNEWLAHNKNKWNARMQEMRRRQLLIEYDENPAQTWEFLRRDHGLTFSHRPRSEQRSADYPSLIRPEQLTNEQFIRENSRHNGLLDNVTPRGLEIAAAQNLSPEQRRSYLGQLQRPDVPGLVDLILADLDFKDSRGFGQHSIHRQLTRAQLEELGRRRPALLRDQQYVTERLARIPVPEEEIAHDHQAAADYYQEIWDFVRTLGDMHNSLKANTLYHLLNHQRQLGHYDRELFEAYIRLPRPVHYLPQPRREQLQRQRVEWVNFSFQPGHELPMPPIGNEEPLVLAFLLELLKDQPNPDAYRDLFESKWLNALFAESKLLHGVGQPADWAHLLTPEAYRAILDRVELDFAPENPSYIQPGEDVTVQVDIKRVDTLLLKIYEIQTFNYYTTHKQPVDQSVELDGMVPTHQRTLNVKAEPSRRVRHQLDLPEVNQRGVYVVELIGNGVSSRALLHIGQLESIQLPTASGQAVMILNEAGETVVDGKIWMNGREYSANERGLILLPYSENPGVRFAVLRDGSFNSPEQIRHLGEDYSFHAGIHVDPQSLNRRSAARLILRPDLRIHGIPLDPERLQKVKVTLASTDAQGTRSEREFTADFESPREWSRDFYVPDGLRKVEVTVEASLKRNIDLEEITLRDRFSLDVNRARTGNTLRQVFLVPSAGGRRLEVRGLNGEPIADEPLRVYLHHPGFKRPLDYPVTTDAEGSVALGTLDALDRIRVTGTDLSLDLPLTPGRTLLPSRLHLLSGETVSLPYPHTRSPDLQAVSLFRKKHNKILETLNEQVTIENGELRIEGLAAGSYQLTLHESGNTVELEVVEGTEKSGYLLARHQRLQRTNRQLPSVASVARDGNQVTVRLRHPNRNTRVAVRAFRYEGPGGNLPPGFGFPDPFRRLLRPSHNQYVSGRAIGDEYRYVLERQSRTPFAGSLLDRPGLILNPWELRETSAEREKLKQDQAYRKGRQKMNEAAVGGGGGARSAKAEASRYEYDDSLSSSHDIGVDYLPTGSRWWLNRFPDDQGRVELELEGLNEHTALEIVVLDRFGSTVTRHLLPDRNFEPREVRLQNGLDPDQAFSRQKQVRRIEADTPVVFPELATTRYQVIRDLGQAFDLLHTLSGNPDLADFQFLKNWHTLDEEAKREKYGEFASHELHLFLHQRDPDFFNAVVKPYLANKKDKTFVDRWLLDELREEDTRLDSLQHRNALELALLARRGGDRSAMRAALREAWELLPPDPEGFARRVRVALQAGELDAEASLERDARREQAENLSRHVISGISAPSSRSAVAADAFGGGVRGRPAAQPAPAAEASLAMEQAKLDAPAGELMLMELGAEALDSVLPMEDRLYRALPKTKEWAEQNYYKLRVKEDVPERLTVNAFWRNVADEVELSPHLLQCHRNLTDVLAALAFCGLPFEAEAPVETPEGAQLTLTVSAPALLVSEQILSAGPSEDDRPLLLSQQFFSPDDRYRFEDNEQIEKFISGEFIRRKVYGARVTLTNPTASRRRLNVLLQIPQGAIPVQNGFYTDDPSLRLEPYTTRTVEYFFTFPESGTFPQYPAHAAAEEAIIGKAEPRVFEVKDAPTEVDKTSWAWVSQHASPEDTLAFLRDHNLRRLDLDEMAWRLKDDAFYEQVIDLLTNRGFFHSTTFSYSVHHRDPATARVWLANSPAANGVGPVFESPLLTVDPVETGSYEHLEYDPLVNPRAHDVGDTRVILNEALRDQYRSFLSHSLYRNELNAHERLALVYYLLLQDRLEEAVAELEDLTPDQAHEQLQLDYLRAWLALRNLETDRALALAEPHLNHPVPRWRKRFQAVRSAVEESRGGEFALEGDPDRQQDLNRIASGEPSIEVKTDAGELKLTSHNLQEVTLNLYPMDIELLFSRKPFLSADGADFAVIRPAWSQNLNVRGDGSEEDLILPEDYRDQNLMVELTGKGKRATVAWYANRLRVRKMESVGQVEVRSAADNQPLPKTYVKVFAKGVDNRVSFWKDGYTDLRGRFDYLSLNDRQPEEAAEFSILILHPERGAHILQAAPPTR